MPAPLTEPVTIRISGRHDTGRSTIAHLFAQWLSDNGYADVHVTDTPPLSEKEKGEFSVRFAENRKRPIRVVVETIEHTRRNGDLQSAHVCPVGECAVCGWRGRLWQGKMPVHDALGQACNGSGREPRQRVPSKKKEGGSDAI